MTRPVELPPRPYQQPPVDVPPGYEQQRSGLIVPQAAMAPRAGGALIQRTPFQDDDGTGEVGTIINNAWKQELYNQIDAAIAASGSVVQILHPPVVSGGTITVPNRAALHLCIFEGLANDLTVTGTTSAAVNERLMILNWTNYYVLVQRAPSGTPFSLYYGSAAGVFPLGPWGSGAEFLAVVDPSGVWWQALRCSQNWPKAIPNTAFTAASGVLTVSNNASWYYVSDRQMFVQIRLTGSTSASSTAITLTIPDGWLAWGENADQPIRVNNNAFGFARPNQGTNTITLWPTVAADSWASGTQNIFGRISYFLQ